MLIVKFSRIQVVQLFLTLVVIRTLPNNLMNGFPEMAYGNIGLWANAPGQ